MYEQGASLSDYLSATPYGARPAVTLLFILLGTLGVILTLFYAVMMLENVLNIRRFKKAKDFYLNASPKRAAYVSYMYTRVHKDGNVLAARMYGSDENETWFILTKRLVFKIFPTYHTGIVILTSGAFDPTEFRSKKVSFNPQTNIKWLSLKTHLHLPGRIRVPQETLHALSSLRSYSYKATGQGVMYGDFKGILNETERKKTYGASQNIIDGSV